MISSESRGQEMEERVDSVLSAVQQFLMSKSAVFVVVWSLADAPDGLHTVTRHLVDIQVGKMGEISICFLSTIDCNWLSSLSSRT